MEQQIAVFCETDDFCKAYEEYCHHSLLMTKDEILPKSRMSLSEIMTILIMFQLSNYRSFEAEDVIKAVESGEISFDAPEGKVTIKGDNHHLVKPVRIGQIGTDGLISEIYATEPVAPDPYISTYQWAVDAGIQPLE